MTPLTHLSSLACPLPLENIDTDQLIPARFMKESRANGYGNFLLYDMRINSDGDPRDFILNNLEPGDSEILVTRRNFGGGSSREAAVYALVDFGFRCVIAPSFGDIFSSNAVNNSLLPAVVSEQDCERILQTLAETPSQMEVDLASQIIKIKDMEFPFEINSTWKLKLINGWDDIDLTLAKTEKIENFKKTYQENYPWLR